MSTSRICFTVYGCQTLSALGRANLSGTLVIYLDAHVEDIFQGKPRDLDPF